MAFTSASSTAQWYSNSRVEIMKRLSSRLRYQVRYSTCLLYTSINQELVDKGLAAYTEKGIKARGYVCDVTDEPAVQAMVAQIEQEVGSVDILVNNAGIIRRVPMHEMEAADFRRVIDIDLNAPFIVSKAVLPAMMKKGHVKIINICSMMSELGRETVSDVYKRQLLFQISPKSCTCVAIPKKGCGKMMNTIKMCIRDSLCTRASRIFSTRSTVVVTARNLSLIHI